uniref:Uncharacterized protein n=1 Tax=Tanacetum cinerariifolium TaxID=118510 RepID=A0A6L2MS74_TANCI|nr:uncharacterized protein [Tanacetum cinerariifolium]
MKHTRLLTTNPSRPIIFYPAKLSSNLGWVYGRARPSGLRLPVACLATHDTQMAAASPANISDVGSSGVLHESLLTGGKSLWWEETLEKVIYNCRFMTLLAVMGSLIGSVLCFIKGCAYVVASYQEYFVNHGRGIFMLIEATDVYLLGTVMLVFGMGLYELFISNLDVASSTLEETTRRSNLFGLFALKAVYYYLLVVCICCQSYTRCVKGDLSARRLKSARAPSMSWLYALKHEPSWNYWCGT